MSAKKQKSKNSKIALLGLGLDNLALLNLLDKHRAPVEITVCDFRAKAQLPIIKTKNLKINYRLGAQFNQNLSDFSLLFRSPGWPIACPGIQAALKNKNTKLSSPLNLFFELCPSKNIIGVTGTKGKGTTASLIFKILEAKNKLTNKKSLVKRQVFLGGNIGVAPLSFLEKINPTDFVVLELSSFQLEDLKYSPKIAVITNLFKEHLAPADPNNPNYHSSLQKYWQAKLNIAKHKANKFLVINQSLKAKIKSSKLDTKIIFFSANNLKSKLSGAYNQENVGAAVAVAKILKIKTSIYQKVIANFSNLEHRLELVKETNNIKYFDNSFSTTPESTILDLKSFPETIIQIAGGADKGADFSALAKTIKQKQVFLIMLPGKGSNRIINELTKINFPAKNIIRVNNMEEAVKLAQKKAKHIQKENPKTKIVVLLSTACASFGIFKNYKERGNLFKEYVKKHT